MLAPDDAIAAVLDAADIGLEEDENLLTGPVRVVGGGPGQSPANAVFCLSTGGQAPVPYLSNAGDVRRANVQVRVRNQSFYDGQELAEDVLVALQRAEVPDYFSCRVLSEVTYLATDDEGLHEWSINVELGYSA